LLKLLHKIKTFFGIHETSECKAAGFILVKLSDIINVIIPHFKQYPLQSCKNFKLWSQCVKIMGNKEHI